MKVSAAFRLAVLRQRAGGTRQSELAQHVGFHPTTFSAILSGGLPVKAGDPRIVRLATLLNVAPDEIFAPDAERIESKR